MNDHSKAAILLVSRMVRAGATPLNARRFWKLLDQLEDFNDLGGPGDLLGRTGDELTHAGLAPDMAARVVELLARGTAMAFELERLDRSGITTLTPFDDIYPRRLHTTLGPNAPVILHAAGALEVLDRPGVGVVGSRNVGKEGADVARALGERTAELGVPVISGAARGVDQLAMRAAMQAGGRVMGIPAHPFVRTLRDPAVRRAVYNERLVMCTPYAPESPFTVGKAMGRNKLIYALSAVTVAVASDHGSGGTWSGATESLKGEYGRVAVWRGPGEGPGNEHLERAGATPITDVSQLDELLADRPPEPAELPGPGQASLFS